MDRSTLDILIKRLEAREIDHGEFVKELEAIFVVDLGFARLDTHRDLRQGLPEVVYGPEKTPGQVSRIVAALMENDPKRTVVLSRATKEQIESAEAAVGPARVFFHGVDLADSPHATALWNSAAPRKDERVCVVTAGTADLKVATEVTAVLYAFGIDSDLVPDCGVAGIHRLFEEMDRIRSADVIIVAAGMEGALASVVSGLVRVPVIAVPTSAGYGSSFDGITALLSMMASCSPGISVVGIDNGFGAAAAAMRILEYGKSRLG